ncbi:MAG: DUF1450 domain-containing protein [Paenibacillaceae bacterium]
MGVYWRCAKLAEGLKLEQLAPDTEVKVGCKSYCGPCSRFAFIYINGRYVTGVTEDEVIEKVRKFVK